MEDGLLLARDRLAPFGRCAATAVRVNAHAAHALCIPISHLTVGDRTFVPGFAVANGAIHERYTGTLPLSDALGFRIEF